MLNNKFESTASDDSFEIGFIHSDKIDYTLFERRGKEANYYSYLTNVFDYNNDNINELSFMDFSITNHNYNCSTIYYLTGDEFGGVQNCNYVLEEVK